ncbi:MAG: hypothetical protein AB7S26_30620 [Sandaracinaceae bacterium]
MRWPPEVRDLVRELREQLGSEDEVVRRLAHLGARTLLAARSSLPAAGVARVSRAEDLPSVEDVLHERLAAVGLALDVYQEGRPNWASVSSVGGVKLVGEPEVAEPLRINDEGVDAYVVSLSRRSGRGNAIYTVTLSKMDDDSKFGRRSTQLFLFVLREERRVWAVTRAEMVHVHELLKQRKKAPRFSLVKGKTSTVRVALPRGSSGLDLAFPRVVAGSNDA